MLMQKKRYIYIINVHIDRENPQETPDFIAYMETYYAYVWRIYGAQVMHTHDGLRTHGNQDLDVFYEPNTLL